MRYIPSWHTGITYKSAVCSSITKTRYRALKFHNHFIEIQVVVRVGCEWSPNKCFSVIFKKFFIQHFHDWFIRAFCYTRNASFKWRLVIRNMIHWELLIKCSHQGVDHMILINSRFLRKNSLFEGFVFHSSHFFF